MTDNALHFRLDANHRRLGRARCIARASGTAFIAAALAVVGCNADNGSLFGSDVELAPLRPPPSLDGGLGAGGGPAMPAPDPGFGSGPGAAGTSTQGPAGGGTAGGGTAGGGTAGGAGAPQSDAGAPPGARPPSDGSCGQPCVRNGGRCQQGTCYFDCQAPDSCSSGQVRCPSGVPCDVTCGTRACTDNVVCALNGECTVRCEGELSCAREVICEGQCDVSCAGPRSCRGGIGGSVEQLELSCSGSQSCGSTVQCEGQDCRVECSGPESCSRVRIFAMRNSLRCTGPGSCASDVTCLGGRCSAECASDACENGIDCDALECQLAEPGSIATDGDD